MRIGPCVPASGLRCRCGAPDKVLRAHTCGCIQGCTQPRFENKRLADEVDRLLADAVIGLATESSLMVEVERVVAERDAAWAGEAGPFRVTG